MNGPLGTCLNDYLCVLAKNPTKYVPKAWLT
ncbi:hypothetical protein SAMN04490179_2430 [Pseudomonas antarctica]|uniref:Uncharacterized protein n=1 Tax=Pseudomonas antarctica TaxID=219572 RepID=A0A1G9YIF2_9PSED|nr:hypothetical protein PSAN_30160 [Pseudomonas antarctica]SDN08672.1 hypothetical protein SAMN04490179_2430 [Pseudomonas antarctica]